MLNSKYFYFYIFTIFVTFTELEESKEEQIVCEDTVQEEVEKDTIEAEDGNDENNSEEDSGLTPTPHQDLDIKAMKVVDLRQELEARGLNTAGLKSQLATRLQKAIEEEKEKEAGEAENEASETTEEKGNVQL